MKTTFRSVSRTERCPICDGDHKCSRGADGLIMCGRPPDVVPFGFVHLGPAKTDTQFHLYRFKDDPILGDRDYQTSLETRNGQRSGLINWDLKAKVLAKNLTPELREKLAADLGLPYRVLDAFSALGFDPHDQHGPCWTLPEMDFTGKVISLNRRYENGSKKVMAGGSRGLAIPSTWNQGTGPLFLPEGHSDVLALSAMGLATVGRPNNTAGVHLLQNLLATWPVDRPIVVLGEFDPKNDGRWPGRDGAVKVAGELAGVLGRDVSWALPPDEEKDVRKWVLQQNPDPNCQDEWDELGDRFWTKTKVQLQPVKHREGSKRDYRLEAINSADFFAREYRLRWHTRRILARDQPAIFGGPRKGMKTSLLVAFVVSQASGIPFLGKFEVEEPCPVLLISGESGEGVLQETAKRICASMDVDPFSLTAYWDFRLPQVGSKLEMERLASGIRDLGPGVVIIDPLYLCLLVGGNAQAVEAGNLYSMGPLLRDLSSACLEAGATPVLAHHARKGIGRTNEPLDLDDLSFAGIAEFARQWVLVNRREAFEAGSGSHRLWLGVGGSVGHSGVWGIDIEEGKLADDFSGRRWHVTVNGMTDLKTQAEDQRDRARREKGSQRDRADEEKFVVALDQLDPEQKGVALKPIRERAGLNSSRGGASLTRLVAQRVVKEIYGIVKVGNGAEKPVRLIVRRMEK